MPKQSAFRNIVLITGIGFSVIVPILLMTFLGVWLDGLFSTRFITVIAVIIGISGGVSAAWQLIRKFMPKNEKSEEYDLLSEWKKDGTDGGKE